MKHPGRHSVLGVMVDGAEYEAAVATVLDDAVRRRRLLAQRLRLWRRIPPPGHAEPVQVLSA